ncbi:MAG TPA: substrate-binding domain-containing protein [Acidobacteriota bacterium]|nr:substrate-binding domain-containing protein [Acidobacteriota bacterium]
MTYLVSLTIFLLTVTSAFGSQWYEDYEKGRGKVKKGDCAEGEKLLLTALQKNPKPDVRSRPYGTITLEYIPHFYLAQCAFEKGEMVRASEYLKQASQYGIETSTQAKDFNELKQKVTTQGKALESGIVIVINPQNNLADITSKDLKEIYLGTKTQWPNGTQITPVLYTSGSKLNDFFLTKICGMDETVFNSYWESRSASSKVTPMFVDQDDWVTRYIERSVGAIGFIDARKAGSLRVIKLDGKNLDVAGYLLAGN